MDHGKIQSKISRFAAFHLVDSALAYAGTLPDQRAEILAALREPVALSAEATDLIRRTLEKSINVTADGDELCINIGKALAALRTAGFAIVEVAK